MKNLRRCEASSQPKLVLHSDLTFLAGNFRHPVTDQIPGIEISRRIHHVSCLGTSLSQCQYRRRGADLPGESMDPDDSLVPLDEPQTLKTFRNQGPFPILGHFRLVNLILNGFHLELRLSSSFWYSVVFSIWVRSFPPRIT